MVDTLRRRNCSITPCSGVPDGLGQHAVTTYGRAYTFLTQIFDYGNTDFEKRAIFFKYLVRLLKLGRERSDVDLSQITLTHHRLKKLDPRQLPLSGQDAPKPEPGHRGEQRQRAGKVGVLPERDHRKAECDLRQRHDGRGSIGIHQHARRQDAGIETVAAASDQQHEGAIQRLPDLTTEIIEAVMQTMEVQQELSTRALNSPEVRDGVKHWLLNYFKLYEKLRDRAATA